MSMSTGLKSTFAASRRNHSAPDERCWSVNLPGRGVSSRLGRYYSAVSIRPTLRTDVTAFRVRAGFPCSVICKDSAVRCPNDAVDQLRRLLTAQKVLSHDRDGKLGNQKLREPYLVAPLFPKHP